MGSMASRQCQRLRIDRLRRRVRTSCEAGRQQPPGQHASSGVCPRQLPCLRPGHAGLRGAAGSLGTGLLWVQYIIACVSRHLSCSLSPAGMPSPTCEAASASAAAASPPAAQPAPGRWPDA